MNFKGFLLVGFLSAMSFGQNKTAMENLLLTENFILGRFDYKIHEQFIKVNTDHASKTIYLNKEAYKAFISMFNQAKADGISLKIISGTRNFKEQKAIWDRKWETYNTLEPIKRAEKILKYSSMPSTSRHHWGTDIDLNSLRNTYFEKSQGKEEYEWLLKNANKFGFHQIYTDKSSGRTGYNLERWHWSYMPLVNPYLSYYNKHINYSDIKGFKGSELASELNIILDYVNGISNRTTANTQD